MTNADKLDQKGRAMSICQTASSLIHASCAGDKMPKTDEQREELIANAFDLATAFEDRARSLVDPFL